MFLTVLTNPSINIEKELQGHVGDMPLPLFPRSQAPAWECVCARSPGFGQSPVTGSQGASPASAFLSRGLGTRNEKKELQGHVGDMPLPLFPRSQAPASGSLPSREARASPASAFPSRGLGTRKKRNCRGMSATCPCHFVIILITGCRKESLI